MSDDIRPAVFSDEQLTEIYNKANGIEGGKNPPITTQRIFAAMRAMPASALKAAQVKVLREVVDWLNFTGDERAAFGIHAMADELERSK